MEVLQGVGAHGRSASSMWVEHLRVADLSCGTYSLATVGEDRQEPHTEDEIYVCTTGRAMLWTPSGVVEMIPGVVVFVPAGEEHHFTQIVEDFTVVVIFGPAELTRQPAS